MKEKRENEETIICRCDDGIYVALSEEAASRMTELLREDEDFLESAARQIVPEGAVSLDRETFEKLPPAVGTRVLRILSENAGGRTPEAAHIREILRLASSPLSRSVSLPGGIRCVSNREGVRTEREERGKQKQSGGGAEEEEPVAISPDRPVQILRQDGFCRVSCVIGFPPPGGFPAADAEGRTEENIYKSSISVSLCFDKITFACRVRVRKPGDVIRFGGMTRRVKTLFSGTRSLRISAALPGSVSLPYIRTLTGISRFRLLSMPDTLLRRSSSARSSALEKKTSAFRVTSTMAD